MIPAPLSSLSALEPSLESRAMELVLDSASESEVELESESSSSGCVSGSDCESDELSPRLCDSGIGLGGRLTSSAAP